MTATHDHPSRPATAASEHSSIRLNEPVKDIHPVIEKAASDQRITMKSNNESIFVKSRDADDVFGEYTVASKMPRSDAQRIAAGAHGESSDNNAAKTDVQAPRADRIMSPITPANAQGLLPPEACVFAANFSMMRTDEQLEYSCHQAFDVFGRCLVKVRRDKHRHPFALIQFYNATDAANAIEGSRGLVIDGRSIRTEPAQARRAVILVKADGNCPTHDEARSVLGQYGPIEKTYPTTNGDATRLGVPQGIWVQFTYYLDYKDAVKFFNNTGAGYKVHVPPEPEPRVRPFGFASPMGQMWRSPRSPTDQKSIFIGNLPQDATEFELRDLFAAFGTIRAVNLIHKPIQGGVGYNVFAFIEYSDISQAIRAAEQEFDLRGQRIRVEPKEYSARRNTRLQQAQTGHMFPGSPHYGMSGPYHAHGGMVHYNPDFQHLYGMSPGPRSFNDHREMSPYPPGTFNQNRIYATPPSSNRVGRSDFGMHSPEAMPFFSPMHYQSHYTNMGAPQE